MKADFVGIDVSKDTLDVELLPIGKYLQVSNDAAGFKQISQRLKKLGIGNAYVCMEATNRYWEQIAHYLHEQGHTVFVVNPARIKGFAQSEQIRQKTDKLDAGLIARFCQAHISKLRPWSPPKREIRVIQELERELDAVKCQIVEADNRLQSGMTYPPLIDATKRLVGALKLQAKQIEALIKEHYESSEELKFQRDLLLSIISVGEVTASTFLGEVGDVSRFAHVRQLEAYLGVSLKFAKSGKSVYKAPRLAKVGSPRMRKTLYMAALNGMYHNPLLIAYAERLRSKNKKPKVIICAVMRKLLRIIYGVLKSGQPFNAEHQVQLRTA